ncbi:uncharacterized protein LOC131013143 [Salvia miltiorrhiza]|uniref:uncharacterized protein LOC131013143 n=1 Tax=Salvia miltiorrhiza TaxID=226208 RepID=UPI0025AD2A09|nr:uncharacterized protein LOC131013143 [Salvia miltiorrhiza]
MAERKGIGDANPVSQPHNDAKPSNVIEGTINENESRVHNAETHGKSDDINENTQIDEVKGPSVVQRVKEEVEAVFEAVVHPKK